MTPTRPIRPIQMIQVILQTRAAPITQATIIHQGQETGAETEDERKDAQKVDLEVDQVATKRIKRSSSWPKQ